MNEKALGFFKSLAEVAKPESVKLAANTDFSEIDSKFILKYATPQSHILDLGSGSGLIVNKIYPFVEAIVCVDAFEQFTQFIVKDSKITIFNQDLFAFDTKEQFDMITAFGTMHYMNEEESIRIYQKYRKYLKPSGKLIVKNQFGINETVNVSGYSKEQQ